MVEQAWLDEGDVVVPGVVLENFDKMQKYIRYVEKHYPSVHSDVVNNLVSLKEIVEKKEDKQMVDSEKIRVEFDKINTDDFCAWLLHNHIDMFKKLHKEYLNDATLTSDEKKEFKVDFDMIKQELGLPRWVVNGKCISKGEVICNLGYACDGCPYNKDGKKQ